MDFTEERSVFSVTNDFCHFEKFYSNSIFKKIKVKYGIV
ncbi:hypothetical protein G436_4788 [Leptospira interrogans serovar Hardjo str. Norma]|uniref:Uncharacterized protein n=1 Tax=Leptospira interrogans serovar Hardjo str. Norma TaxID=1279460 RepID=A0A0M4MYY6_LEPIR|nr:hypothetical protein G436_4788 [Leptospira interrogans serovar Hardjo str. Norma]